MGREVTPHDAGAEYARWLAKTGLADTTKQLYPQRVAAFLSWLEGHADEHADALEDPYARDYAVRDYRRDLLTVDKRAIATVELAMSALGSFYEWLGLGKPDVKRTSPPKGAPKSLDEKELRAVMRTAERRGVRDFALTSLLFLTAVRVSEAAALDTDDVLVTERTGLVQVRYGKGGESRDVPMPTDARAALRPWLAQRRERYGDQVGPLFVARGGGRLSVRRMQSLMADIGKDAGVHISPHVLRHSYARAFLDGGGDVASLQAVLGHKNLSSTQVYTAPRAGRLAELAENVRIEL
jgi:integrase/recombinase XerC